MLKINENECIPYEWTYRIWDEARHMRNTSPWDQVNGLQKPPNRWLLIPQRDASTVARIRMYIAKLVCCVFGPVKSIDGPAIRPASRDLQPEVLNQNTKRIYIIVVGLTKYITWLPYIMRYSIAWTAIAQTTRIWV